MTPSLAKFLLSKAIPLRLHDDHATAIGTAHVGIPVSVAYPATCPEDLVSHKWHQGTETVYYEGEQVPVYEVELKGMTNYGNLSKAGLVDYQRELNRGVKERS